MTMVAGSWREGRERVGDRELRAGRGEAGAPAGYAVVVRLRADDGSVFDDSMSFTVLTEGFGVPAMGEVLVFEAEDGRGLRLRVTEVRHRFCCAPPLREVEVIGEPAGALDVATAVGLLEGGLAGWAAQFPMVELPVFGSETFDERWR
ncbi:hypothetical protein [Nocardia amamiensis]|uniref:hypothetical protein n=1 Tax=Nocardia amamiensis TaxID=404578 RepID=UPI0012F4D6C8|nr:hypothetical protein [Nocardia amamiensis]